MTQNGPDEPDMGNNAGQIGSVPLWKGADEGPKGTVSGRRGTDVWQSGPDAGQKGTDLGQKWTVLVWRGTDMSGKEADFMV